MISNHLPEGSTCVAARALYSLLDAPWLRFLLAAGRSYTSDSTCCKEKVEMDVAAGEFLLFVPSAAHSGPPGEEF